jgi:hypothetical protein
MDEEREVYERLATMGGRVSRRDYASAGATSVGANVGTLHRKSIADLRVAEVKQMQLRLLCALSAIAPQRAHAQHADARAVSDGTSAADRAGRLWRGGGARHSGIASGTVALFAL